jgi:hypothetical protein
VITAAAIAVGVIAVAIYIVRRRRMIEPLAGEFVSQKWLSDDRYDKGKS